MLVSLATPGKGSTFAFCDEFKMSVWLINRVGLSSLTKEIELEGLLEFCGNKNQYLSDGGSCFAIGFFFAQNKMSFFSSSYWEIRSATTCNPYHFLCHSLAEILVHVWKASECWSYLSCFF